MKKELLKKIRSNPLVYSYLRENSYEYEYLLRDENYYRELDRKARVFYKKTYNDMLDKFSDKLNMIEIFLNILK